MSSIKALTGHGLGAASAIEAVACVQALREQIAPPTWNFTRADPDCDWDAIPNEPRELELGSRPQQRLRLRRRERVARPAGGRLRWRSCSEPAGSLPTATSTSPSTWRCAACARSLARAGSPASLPRRRSAIRSRFRPAPERCAVVLGTRFASIEPLVEFNRVAVTDGPGLVNPSSFPNVVVNAHAGYLGILFGLAGPNVTLCGEAPDWRRSARRSTCCRARPGRRRPRGRRRGAWRRSPPGARAGRRRGRGLSPSGEAIRWPCAGGPSRSLRVWSGCARSCARSGRPRRGRGRCDLGRGRSSSRRGLRRRCRGDRRGRSSGFRRKDWRAGHRRRSSRNGHAAGADTHAGLTVSLTA